MVNTLHNSHMSQISGRKNPGIIICNTNKAEEEVLKNLFNYYKKFSFKEEITIYIKERKGLKIIPTYNYGNYTEYDNLLLSLGEIKDVIVLGHFDKEGFFWSDYE